MSATNSWRVVVKTPGDVEWVGNGVRWPTRERAEAAGADLACRWTAVREWRVEASEDEPNREV